MKRESKLEQHRRGLFIVKCIMRYWNKNSRTGFILTNSFKYEGMVTAKDILYFAFEETEKSIPCLTDYTAVQCIYKTLDDDKVRETPEIELFMFTYLKACQVIRDVLKELKIEPDEQINIPKFAYSNYNLLNINLTWKYFAALSFVKPLLRRYATVYKTVNTILKNKLQDSIKHVKTVAIISRWIDGTTKIL